MSWQPSCEHALASLVDSLVLSYRYDADQELFVLTCDYWDKAAGADRAFIEFELAGARRFERTKGAVAELQRHFASFVARDADGAYVVEEVRLGRHGDIRRLRLSLGHSFGGLELEFRGLECLLLDASARRVGDGWQYAELRTGRVIDFFDPFGRDAPAAGKVEG